ncbi:hypothetical protein OPV22_002201 [Ensete ventricosum]|uniref:Cytochrome P450 n=1 Tax=Ensete ventricosum TaxID=4639 RepID=A0AAV8RX89_ENSVE|nr:hypothetical protein OPV22_002201 [Ensete ventricosum]
MDLLFSFPMLASFPFLLFLIWPERWLEAGVFQARSAFQYPVFHAGPRMCLGKEMAVIQMKAITASILEGFDIELTEQRGKHDLSISMRMEGGLPMRFRERRAL